MLSLYIFTVVDMSHPVKPSLKHIELDQNREIIEIMSLDAPWHSMSSRMMILEKFTFMMPIEGRVLFEHRRSNLTKTRLLDIHSRKRLTCLVVKWITKRSTSLWSVLKVFRLVNPLSFLGLIFVMLMNAGCYWCQFIN